MATYIKDNRNTPILAKIFFIIFALILVAGIIYPAYKGAVINCKTLSLEFPKDK